MNSLKLKICGMKDPNNIRAAAALGPDYLGFIFYPDSPRFVGTSFQIPADIPSSIGRIGVFVNQSLTEVVHQHAVNQLTYAQLHGDESINYCRILKSEGIQIIKAFAVDEAFDFSVLEKYEDTVDYFLFDTPGKLPGGNGVPFYWKVLEKYALKTPFFLSGGLSMANIGDAMCLQHPFLHALDFNSSIELSPGHKRISSINEIISIIRQNSSIHEL